MNMARINLASQNSLSLPKRVHYFWFKNVETEGLGDYSFFFFILENGSREQKWYTYFLYLTH